MEREFAGLKARFSGLTDADLERLAGGEVVEAVRRVWVSGHLRHRKTRKETFFLRYDETAGRIGYFTSREAAERSRDAELNGKPYEIQKPVVMEENMNAERLEKGRPIDAFLGGDPAEAAVYGLAFDKAAEYLRDVLRKMCDHIGWKDKTRPYDFDGFSGYYPEIHEDHADICQGDYIVATFKALADGRLGFESYGGEFAQYPDDVNPWYPLADIMDGRLCLEPGNLEKAVQETHHGQEVIYAVRFDEDTAVACRAGDVRLKAALVEQEPSLRFVSPEKLLAAMNRWMEADARPGFEDAVRPEIIRYAWDGDKLRSEKEVNIDQSRQLKESWGNDWDLIAGMRREGEEIRAELERAAGIPEGEGAHFKFENALYPCLGIRDDALFLVSGCGRTMGDFITVANGNVSLYREYDPDSALSEPLRRFDSAQHAMSVVRKHILGEKNVSLAAADYQTYLKSQAETKVQKQDNEPSKGVKMR